MKADRAVSLGLFSARNILGMGFFLFMAMVCYVLTKAGLLILLVGALFCFFLFMFCYIAPDKMFIGLLATSIVIPIDFAVQVGSLPRLGPTRIYLYIFIVAAVVRSVVYGKLWEHGKKIFPLKKPVMAYVLLAAASSFVSLMPRVSLYAVIGREVIEQVILFYLAIYFLQGPGFWRRLRSGLYAATFIVIAFALFEQVTWYNPFLNYYPVHEEEKVFVRAGMLRVRASFFHPIALACFLNMVFPFAIADFLRVRDPAKKFKLVVFIGLIGLCMFMTVSRAPWMCMALEAGVFVLWSTRQNVARMFLIICLGAICLIFGAMAYNTIPTVHDLFEPLFAGSKVRDTSTMYYRWVVIEAAWGFISQSPDFLKRLLLGFGPNVFFYTGLTNPVTGVTLSAPDLHYARIAFEQGLLGLLSLGGMIVACLWATAKGVRQAATEDEKLVPLACFAGVLGFAVVNFTVSMFQLFPLGFIYWILVSLGVTYQQSQQMPQPPPKEEQAPA